MTRSSPASSGRRPTSSTGSHATGTRTPAPGGGASRSAGSSDSTITSPSGHGWPASMRAFTVGQVRRASRVGPARHLRHGREQLAVVGGVAARHHGHVRHHPARQVEAVDQPVDHVGPQRAAVGRRRRHRRDRSPRLEPVPSANTMPPHSPFDALPIGIDPSFRLMRFSGSPLHEFVKWNPCDDAAKPGTDTRRDGLHGERDDRIGRRRRHRRRRTPTDGALDLHPERVVTDERIVPAQRRPATRHQIGDAASRSCRSVPSRRCRTLRRRRAPRPVPDAALPSRPPRWPPRRGSARCSSS